MFWSDPDSVFEIRADPDPDPFFKDMVGSSWSDPDPVRISRFKIHVKLKISFNIH